MAKRLQKCVYDGEADIRICPRCGSDYQPSIPHKRISCICSCGFECEDPKDCNRKVKRYKDKKEVTPRDLDYRSSLRREGRKQ